MFTGLYNSYTHGNGTPDNRVHASGVYRPKSARPHPGHGHDWVTIEKPTTIQTQDIVDAPLKVSAF